MKNRLFTIGLLIAAFTIPAFGQSAYDYKIGPQIQLPQSGPVAMTVPNRKDAVGNEILAASAGNVEIITIPWDGKTAAFTKNFKIPFTILAVHFVSKFNKTLTNTYAPMVFSLEKAGTVTVRVLSQPTATGTLTAVSTGTFSIPTSFSMGQSTGVADSEVFTDANGVTFVNLFDLGWKSAYIGYTRDGKTFTSLGATTKNNSYNLIQTKNGDVYLKTASSLAINHFQDATIELLKTTSTTLTRTLARQITYEESDNGVLGGDNRFEFVLNLPEISATGFAERLALKTVVLESPTKDDITLLPYYHTQGYSVAVRKTLLDSEFLILDNAVTATRNLIYLSQYSLKELAVPANRIPLNIIGDSCYQSTPPLITFGEPTSKARFAAFLR